MDYQSRRWTFLTNHARVLMVIARNPTARLHELAATCQLTQRTAQRIVANLAEAGHLQKDRVGRRNQYTVNHDGPFRHPAEAEPSIRALLDLTTGLKHEDTDDAPGPPRHRLDPTIGP
ncbi:helix-turn-helix transcriptional regulator [Streptomyces sp. NPDC002004]